MAEQDDKKVSAMRAALKGLESGTSMGFNDELAGGVASLGNKLIKSHPKIADMLGMETKYPESLGSDDENYKYMRNLERRETDDAQAAHPYVFKGSELVGEALPGMVGGGGVAAGKVAEGVGAKAAISAAKRQALQRIVRQGALQGGLTAYGHGTRDASDLGNLGDMATGAAGGAAGALIGHGINTLASRAAPEVGAAAAKVKDQFFRPQHEISSEVDASAAQLEKELEEKIASGKVKPFKESPLTDEEQVALYRDRKKTPYDNTNRPTKGLGGPELRDAIGHNLGFKYTDWSDLLPPDAATPVMKPKG